MIQRPHRKHWVTPAMLILSLMPMPLLVGCGEDDLNPAPRSEAATYDRDRFEEGLVAVDQWLADGDATKAEVIAARLVELDPTSIAALQAHGNCLLIMGSLANQNGDDDEGDTEDIAVDVSPDNYDHRHSKQWN